MSHSFPEIVLHHIWQRRLWSGLAQQTTDGLPIEILSAGVYNTDAGPDFREAHLRIGGHEIVGDVELHLSASDWYRHHHDTDPAYDRVVLHVVREADREVRNSAGVAVVQCELRYPEPEDYIESLLRSMRGGEAAGGACGRELLRTPGLLTEGWRQALLAQRMQCKQQSISRLLEITQHSWEHAFYITLAHNFGFHTNGQPFEELAIRTPLSYLQKHRDSLFQLTAMLLGQSGLLAEDTAASEEEQRLLREYRFLQKKFGLTPIDRTLWKRGRMRPAAFPETRIRQFAQLLHQSEFLFSQLMEARDIDRLRELLTLRPIVADTQRVTPAPGIGKASIDILLINTVVPYQYAYAQAREGQAAAEAAGQLLTKISAEDNRIIRQWRLLGQPVRHAADTQALLHLFQTYCQPQQCLNCEVGYRIFMDRQLQLF